MIAEVQHSHYPKVQLQGAEHCPTCSCMQDVGRRIPYAFLEDVKQPFLPRHEEEARDGYAYSLDESFKPVLEDRLKFFSRSNEADAINRVRGELGHVRNIMIENIDKVSPDRILG